VAAQLVSLPARACAVRSRQWRSLLALRRLQLGEGAGAMSDEIETVAYQAKVAAEHRPCVGSSIYQPCDQEYPAMPSRWCSGCLIAALLEQPTRMCPVPLCGQTILGYTT
jgi:hypothetical protein